MSAAAVNQRIRVREGVDGTILVVSAWCARCGQESGANDRGECLFCGRVILDEDRLSSKELRTILELQALGFEDGLAAGVHVVLPEEPHAAARRLLETLGATFEVVAGEHPAHLTLVEDRQASPRTRRGRPTLWTREKALAAVKAYAAEHGHPPASTHRDRSVLTRSAARRLFGSWPNMIEQAGFPRPTRGTRYKDSSSEAPERAQEPGAAAPTPAPTLAEVAQPDRAPASPAGDAGSTPALRFALIGVLDALRALVDAALPEEPRG